VIVREAGERVHLVTQPDHADLRRALSDAAVVTLHGEVAGV
jgi:hypothetical protein